MDIGTVVSWIQMILWVVALVAFAIRLIRRFSQGTAVPKWLFSNASLALIISLGLLVSGVSLYLNFRKPKTIEKIVYQAAPCPQGQEAPPPTGEKPNERVFTEKTPADLMKFYGQGLTALQAEKLIQPFVGLWVRADTRVTLLSSDDPATGSSVAGLQYSNGHDSAQIECRFSGKFQKELGRYSIGDRMRIIGRIAPGQVGGQLYLQECEANLNS
jgi:hypothetical protein